MAKDIPRCTALTKKGKPCRNRAISGGLCWIHGGRRKTDPENVGRRVPADEPALTCETQPRSEGHAGDIEKGLREAGECHLPEVTEMIDSGVSAVVDGEWGQATPKEDALKTAPPAAPSTTCRRQIAAGRRPLRRL